MFSLRLPLCVWMHSCSKCGPAIAWQSVDGTEKGAGQTDEKQYAQDVKWGPDSTEGVKREQVSSLTLGLVAAEPSAESPLYLSWDEGIRNGTSVVLFAVDLFKMDYFLRRGKIWWSQQPCYSFNGNSTVAQLLIFLSGEAILTSVLGLNASFVTGLILDFLLQFNGLVGVGWSWVWFIIDFIWGLMNGFWLV